MAHGLWRAGWRARGIFTPFFSELCCLPAGQGGGAVLKAHPQLVRCVQAQCAAELFDIDTKEDLETLQRRILND